MATGTVFWRAWGLHVSGWAQQDMAADWLCGSTVQTPTFR